MKSFSLAIVSAFLLAGCAHYSSYDELGGYGSSSSYSVGVSSGYPVYGTGYYGPVYQPYYVPHGGHRHYHDGHHHRHDRDGRGGRGRHDHDGGKRHDGGGKHGVEGRAHGGGDARPGRGGGRGDSGGRPSRSGGDRK